jgi:hypothetical protein
MLEKLRYWLHCCRPTILSSRIAFWVLKRNMQRDPSWAWSWHCNVAMPFVDLGGDHKKANWSAALFMSRAFEIDTSELPEFQWLSKEWEKPQ